MSNRKIWSIPIAALALMLMLAAALVTTGIVQAQSVTGDTFAIGVGTADTTEIGSVTVSGLTVGQSGANASNDIIARVALTGTNNTHFTAAPGSRVNTGANAGTQPVDISTSDVPRVAGVYNLTLEVYIDTDDDTDTPTISPDNNATWDGDNTPNNDENLKKTSSITIHVIGADTTRVQFHADPNTAFKGEPISALGKNVRTSPQTIAITGLGTNMRIIPTDAETGKVSTTADANGDSGVLFYLSGSDKLIAKSASGSGFPSVNSGSDIDFALIVDSDTTTDVADNDNDPTSDPWRGDGIKDNDQDITGIQVDANIASVSSINWHTDSTNAAYPPFEYTVAADEPAGSVIGEFVVSGATDIDTATGFQGEYLEGILRDKDGNMQSRFAVRGADATSGDNNNKLQIIYMGNGGSNLSPGDHRLRLSVNGDSGILHRTISGGGPPTDVSENGPLDNHLINVTITVNPVSSGPTGPASLTPTVKETDKTLGTILKVGDAVLDVAPLVSDPDTATSNLRYSLKGDDAPHFEVTSAGVVKVVDSDTTTAGNQGILANVTDDIADPNATPPVRATWQRPTTDTGKILDKYNVNSDIEYEFTVNVSDGNAPNSHDIAVTLTVDVNEPVMRVTDATALPAGVTYTAEYEWDHDSDSTTDAMKVPTYSFSKSLPRKDVPHTLFTVGGIMADPDDDTLNITQVDNPSHIIVATGGSTRGNIDVTYLPPVASNTGGLTSMFKITVDDDYNTKVVTSNGDDTDVPDETVYLMITVEETPAPPIDSDYVDITVEENSTTCVQTGMASGCSVAGLFTGGVAYSLESGTDIGPDDARDYAVDATTGAITVVNAPNYEDGKNPRFMVKVSNADDETVGNAWVEVAITDVNEAPTFAADAPATLATDENTQPGTTIGAPIAATDVDGDDVAYSVNESGVPFSVDAVTGQISVSGALDLTASPYTVTVVATDNGAPAMSAEHAVSITIGDVNDPPTFDAPATTTASVDENAPAGYVVATYNGSDVDGADTLEGLHYVLRDADDLKNFEIMSETVSGEIIGKLMVKDGANLDVDAAGTVDSYIVEVNVCDADNACNELTIDIAINDVNDNAPMFATDSGVTVNVMENTARGTALISAIAANGVYAAPDNDKTAPNNSVTYSIDHKSFMIDSATGMLTTLESLDADSMTPCGSTGCILKITATDGGTPAMSDTLDVTVIVGNAEDSVSAFSVSKANPIANISTEGDDAMTALADGKTTESKAVPESPADLPAMMGDEPSNFVSTDWANWDTVLRIEVTVQSPDSKCGINDLQPSGNECVFVSVEGKESKHDLILKAFRSSEKDNMFIAAVKVVRKDQGTDASGPVYKHNGSGVAQLEAEEEDDIDIRLVMKNDKGGFDDSKVAPITVQVENEAPEFDNFMPAHEAAYDDGDVDYTFTITDSVSGIPEPEDLPDPNDNSDYMPLVALVSGDQCYTVDPNNKTHKERKFAGNSIWCKDMPEIRAVTDDRDFDEIDDGFEVETTIVLKENERHWVTFVACDAAGNCELYTPDENKTDKALPQITIDTDEPKLIEAYTGIMWDETDEKLDYDNPTWIQVIFDDLSPLNDDTIEADDFVVQGHTVKDAKRYEDDADDGDRRMVFLELEDQLAPDEEPDVTLVPNGVADIAGNDQDEGEAEAKDRISPSFTVVSIVSPGTPEGSSNVLAGDGEEVVISITSDERIRQTQPEVTITYVNAPATCVETSVDRSKLTVKKSKGDGSTYARGEIILAGDKDNCDSKSAMGGTLGKTFEKISNTEWTVTVKEPEATGYYNIYIKAKDRSDNNNEGSEGVAPDDIDTDFFERNGDVNSGDAHYFQGDINLPNPGVWVSGIRIEETEPDVEFKTPLFVELDFTKKYISDCAKNISDDERNANCYAESDEYAKDSFDSVKVTSFVLDGTDITDSVKTTDNETFLVSIDGISIGDHKIEVQAVDEAGNDFDDTLTIEFEVEERGDFSKRLSPGWNLVSLPGEPADSNISVVFGSDVEVRTVYTYDPVMPGGWMVAVRETVDSDWQGDLTEITARRGYWVLSDAIQDWEVSIPRLAGGAVGSGTPIQPPVIALYAGWNLVPVIDVTGDFDSKHDGKKGISAQAYLQSLDDGLDLARVLGFDTITNSWSTIMAPDRGEADPLEYGKAYWVFVRQAASLVPGN